ncbi:hypothetical protein [Flaviflexus massiliensis]|uniref:hypothetical protein n=1 Tax=Flaviflexus massiliensis TaxID=1522309 RepID=UPI0006D58D95|nr:hypothetical protein [Flaviflexus massiliensis]
MTDGLTQFPFVPGSESDIDSLGESIANIGEALLSTQIASAGAGNIPSDWLGNAFDAYASTMVSYQGQLIDLPGDFSPVQTVINSYRLLFTPTNTRIGQLQEDWNTAHQDFRTEKAELDALAGTLTQADYDTHLQDLVQSRDLHLSELNESYSQALEDLNEEAQTQANTILSHLDSIISPEARLAGRVAVSTELFKDIPLLDGANEFAYFEPYAEEAAALREEPLTLETTAEFNEKYGDLIENPFFANHLIEKLGPEQLANILPQLDDMMELADGNTGLDGAGEPDTFDPSEINELATGIGSVMVLGTGGTNVADPASAEAFDTVKDRLVFSGGRSLVAEQALTRELLMEYGNTVLNAPEEPDAEWNPYYGKHGYDYFITAMGAAATANDGLIVGEEFLLGNGNPGSSMAQDMLAWEKEYGGSRLEDPSRGPWASGTNTSLFGEARVANGYSNAGQTLAPLMDSVTVDQNGPHAEWAVQENEARADVVRTFLAGDTEFLDENMNLARYMTGHRELGFEWTDGGGRSSAIFSSKHPTPRWMRSRLSPVRTLASPNGMLSRPRRKRGSRTIARPVSWHWGLRRATRMVSTTVRGLRESQVSHFAAVRSTTAPTMLKSVP